MLLHLLRLVVRLSLFPLVLRYFGPAEKGLIDIALAVYFVGIVLYLNIDRFQLSVIPQLHAEGRRRSVRTLLWQTYGVHAGSQLLVTLALLLAAGPIASFYGYPELRILIIGHAVGNLVQVLQSPMNRGALIALHQYRRAVLWDVLPLIAEAAATILVITQGLSAFHYVLLLGTAPLWGGLYGWSLYFRQGWQRAIPERAADEPTDKQWLGRLLRFSISVSAGIGVQVFYERMSVLTVAIFYPTETVAIYNLALAVLAMTWSFVALPETVILQALSRAKAAGRDAMESLLRLAYKGMCAIAVIGGAFLAVFAHEIALVMGGREFVGAAVLIAAFSVFPILNAADTVRMLYFVHGHPNRLLKRWTSVVAGEFVSYFPLQHFMGLWGFVVPRIVWRGVFSLLVTRNVHDTYYADRGPDWFARLWWPVIAGVLVVMAAGSITWLLRLVLPGVSLVALFLKGTIWLAACAAILLVLGFLSRRAVETLIMAFRPAPAR